SRAAIISALLAGLSFALPVYAQQEEASTEKEKTKAEDATELGKIVVQGELSRYSALKSDVPIMELARSVSIETQQDMQDKGALFLSAAYTYTAGVYGDTYGHDTRGDWLKVRGLEVPVYRDSLQSLFGYYNNARPHVYTLAQVEILKGPASVLYGRGSPGGLVNLVSKRPRADLQPEVVLQVGNFNYKQIMTDFGGALDESGNWLYRMVAVVRDSDTQVDYVENNATVFMPSISFSPSAMTNFTLIGNYAQYDSDTSAQFVPVAGTLYPAPNGEFIEPSTYLGEPSFNHYDTETQSLTLLADHMLSAIWTLDVTARYTEGSADYSQAWPAFLGGGQRYVYNPDGTLYRNGMVPRTFYASDATSKQYAIDTRLRADFTQGDVKHELMVGVQYQDVTTENDFASAYALGYDFATQGPGPVYGDTYWINVFDPVYGAVPSQAVMDQFYVDAAPATTEDLGLYVNDMVSVGNWRLTGGFRYDTVTNDNGTIEQEDSALSTSVGALYYFDSGFAPYMSYAESFDPVVGVDNVTGESLNPREGRQYEIGMKYQPVGGDTRITVSAFDIEQSNLPNPGGLVTAPSQQEGVATITGVELEAFTRLAAFTLEFNASHLETESPNGYHLASIPENQASTWLEYRPGHPVRGFKAGAGVRYVGKNYDGVDQLVTPAYTLLDLMVGYATEDWDLRLNVRNAADKEYLATCLARGDCFFGRSRTVVGSFTYKF
ncbi:MAG TPA: TonB-dependent siderophore receptor, partial [Gammaproteobacteria bacterium]|nr:TonB-dependent siderophore receptor [Gammaproteobacteria bacterium]